MLRPLKILFALFTFFILVFNYKTEIVKILPGRGICLNNDTIYIEKTPPNKLLKLLNLKDVFRSSYRHWDGVNLETGKVIYGDELVKNIIYNNINFEFIGKTEESLTLKRVRIQDSRDLIVFVNDSIILGQSNPPIDIYFKKKNKSDYISDNWLTYNLYSQGISFRLDSIGQTRKLKEVLVHNIIEEQKK